MRKHAPEALAKQLATAGPVLGALGPVVRQNIIMLFEPEEEISIKDIVEQFNLSRTAVVHHINILLNAGVLKSRRIGKEVLMSLDLTVVAEAAEIVLEYVREYGDSDEEMEV